MSGALAITQRGQQLQVNITGALDAPAIAAAWPEVMQAASTAKSLRFSLAGQAGESGFDTAAATLIATAETRAGRLAEIDGLSAGGLALLARVRTAQHAANPIAPAQPAPIDELARARAIATRALQAMADGLAFWGEVALSFWQWRAGRRQFRVRDMLAQADAAGVQAIPLVLLLGFLMGLILAFQSSIPLKRFGAEVFIVNLVSLSLTRELGPLLASIILSGRTGSAFAAELGTMVVNEEIAALRTMGIDPVRFLVMPRLVAAMLIMPGLSLLLEFAGMIGMAAVMMGLGFPPVAIWNQTRLALRLRDVFGGLFKALWFGAAVSMIGCASGLNAGQGPRAVGEAATSAVVGGIFSTILIDGIFTVLYYRLGW